MTGSTVIELSSLAKRINEQHRLVETSYTRALAHAFEAGQLLIDAKSEVPHGEWLPWLDANVACEERVAQMYMRLASHRGELEAGDPKQISDLGIAAALKRIAKPPPEPKVDVAGALRDLGAPRSAELEQRLDSAQTRRQSGWDDRQERKRVKALEHLEGARSALDDGYDSRLSDYATAELLRRAAVEARHAASVLDDLAFTFER